MILETSWRHSDLKQYNLWLFKQNISLCTRCVICCTILLKPYLFYINILDFFPKLICYHAPIVLTVDSLCLSINFFKKIFKTLRHNYAAWPLCAQHSMHWYLVYLVRIFFTPNAAIWSINIPKESKCTSSEKIFFLEN